MRITRISAAALGLAALTACSDFDGATRNAPLDVPSLNAASAQQVQRAYTVTGMNFLASSSLTVSEGNGFYPMTDIVWRGDPIGDRVAQIASIFDTAMDRNLPGLAGPVPVEVDIRLVRFHGVTERTRYTVGGVYNIVFDMTVRHADTGAILEAPRRIEANLSAPGGVAAIMAEQQGQTEKVRVTDYLTQVLRDELTGFAPAITA